MSYTKIERALESVLPGAVYKVQAPIEDTSGNDLVTIAVAAMTSNTFIDDGSANVTKEARYRLGTGGASDAGLQISCNANGTGSDLVVTLSGSIQ